MGRKNRRAGLTYEPLDVTPEQVNTVRAKSAASYEDRRRIEQERVQRQREARANRAIDWSVCIVPGCGDSLIMWGRMKHDRKHRRDSSKELPICHTHAAVVWNELVSFHTRRGEFVEAIADVNESIEARRQVEAAQAKDAHLASEDGEIYFVRVGGLVKVGWSRVFYDRLKAYGPDVEVLCHYPATRTDETNLHRQLRPALAKGREWYHDGDIIAMYARRAIKEHGQPTVTSYDWTEPKVVTKPRRWAG